MSHPSTPTHVSPTLAAMREASRLLVRIALSIFVVVLIPSLVLGYSGNNDLASIANTLLLGILLFSGTLLVAALILRLSTGAPKP